MAWYDRIKDFFGGMSTEDKQRLAGGVMQTVGGGGEAAHADRAGRQGRSDTERYDRQIRGMNLSQMDPYTQARQRAMMDIMRQGMQNYSPYEIVRGEGGGYTSQGGFGVPEGGYDMSSLNPEALDAALKSFAYNRSAINPFAPSQVEGTEPFRQAQLEDWLSRSGYDNYQGYDPTRTENSGVGGGGGVGGEGGKDFRGGGRIRDASGNWVGGSGGDDGGGGGWKKWLKMAGNVALPIVTGGMSLPAQAAIMGGVGALKGAAGGGGWKGALKGAGTGAGTSLMSRFLLGGGGGGGAAAKGQHVNQGWNFSPGEGVAGFTKAATGGGLGNMATEVAKGIIPNIVGGSSGYPPPPPDSGFGPTLQSGDMFPDPYRPPDTRMMDLAKRDPDNAPSPSRPPSFDAGYGPGGSTGMNTGVSGSDYLSLPTTPLDYLNEQGVSNGQEAENRMRNRQRQLTGQGSPGIPPTYLDLYADNPNIRR